MGTKTIVIAKNYNLEMFYSKKFKNEKEAISHGERIVHQCKGCVVTYLEEKRTGHRWDVDVFEHIKEDINISTLVLNSKKNAKLVAKNLKEYDDTLRVYINKIY